MRSADRTPTVGIADLVNGAGRLFSLPDICLQLQSLIDSPAGDSAEIGRLIASDPALTARILRIANSAFYGLPGKVDSVPQAITLLGTTEVNNLAIATFAAQFFRTSGGGVMDMAVFRRKSILVGLVNRALGEHSGMPEFSAAFVTGLLHDIGRLLVFEQAPQLAASAAQSSDRLQPYWEREQDVLGYTFADVGGLLLQEWQLPQKISEAVRYQHEPLSAHDHRAQATLLHISTRLSAGSMKAPTDEVEYPATVATDCYALTGTEIDASGDIARQMLPKIAEVSRLLFD